MKITLLCSDPVHPVNEYLMRWVNEIDHQHEVSLIRSKFDATGGDILFLISCSEIITEKDRSKFTACLVLHASNLPVGRGWSPHVWEIASGATELTLSLIEATDPVDSGNIWKQTTIPIPNHATWDEINHLLFESQIEMIDFAIKNVGIISTIAQSREVNPTYYPRRTPENSRIDPTKSIAEQFNLLRVCDPYRYPAFFEYLGHRYTIKIEKSKND